MRVCVTCKVTKDLGEFYRGTGYREGRRPQCIPCYNAYYQPRVNHHQKRVGHLMRKYGISPEQYEKMSEAQDHVCAICRRPETALGRGGKVMGLAVDHCHTTGVVRSLLCRVCNQTLGRHQDNPEWFDAAGAYLRRHIAW